MLCKDLRGKLRDRDESSPPYTQLLVSHGGFIKEFLGQLAGRNCRFEGKDYRNISPNTGITRVRTGREKKHNFVVVVVSS